MFLGLARPSCSSGVHVGCRGDGADASAGSTDRRRGRGDGLRLLALDRRVAIERVVETGDGNPLFLEELAGAVDTVNGELPPTVRAATTARIDALPPDVRTALLHASVMGQTFWRGVVAGPDGIEDVEVALDALGRPASCDDRSRAARRRRIRLQARARARRRLRDAPAGHPTHAACRPAAEIERSMRRSGRGRVDPGPPLREAGESERAVRFYLLAAERARDAMATDETLSLYTSALELVGSEEQRRAIRLERGVALVDLGRRPRCGGAHRLLPELHGGQEIEALIGCARAMSGPSTRRRC